MRIGIIGAGMIGSTMAKLWAERGMRFVGAAAEHALLLEKARETVAALRTVKAVGQV